MGQAPRQLIGLRFLRRRIHKGYKVGEIQYIPITKLSRFNLNPRKHAPLETITELGNSLHAAGLMQNLVVRPKDGMFEVICGERRRLAMEKRAQAGKFDAEMSAIPCKVVEATDAECISLGLVENVQREEMSPIDEGDAYVLLQSFDAKYWTTLEISRLIGKSQRYVQQRIAIVTKADKKVKRALAKGKITIEKARVINPGVPKVVVPLPFIRPTKITHRISPEATRMRQAMMQVNDIAIELLKLHRSRKPLDITKIQRIQEISSAAVDYVTGI